ncbi:MAG: GNAT family N-acetyltransferase [Tannerellaceae bacterium]|jgi:aminoglycoside 6'-N-acetyltransferase I|nr:GNAT family N-acetyltransferase [Tannerellaceae bacterium]
MNKISIYKISDNYPYNLLLLADETREAINKYLFDSDVYIAKVDKETVGVFCLLPRNEETIELMNIAVSSEMQNNGIGSNLMSGIEHIARQGKYKAIIVGTADCGFKQIRFYEKNGYSRYDLKKNFFLEKYSEPIYENGVMLKDMVMLKKLIIHESQTGEKTNRNIE